MIEIQNLSFRYRRNRPPVLKDVSVSLKPGAIHGLLGPNGAGKSTLLYLMMGALIPDTGSVTVGGKRSDLRLPSVMSDMMLVPEEVEMPHMTLEKFVSLQAPFYPGFDHGTLAHCLEEFGLRPEGRLTGMSMGQKKKAFMSFAFATRTRILLMDEPTNGLDIPGKVAFRRLCAEMMADDRLFVISTHQVRDLDQLIDHVLIMNSNDIVFNQPLYRIQQSLCFERNAGPEAMARSLWSIPAPGGFDIMTPNADGAAETVVNLELLFDYATHHPAELTAMFNHKTTDHE